MEIRLTIPESLKDITLRQYKAYEKIVKANEQDANAERFIHLKMLEIFCGITYEQAKLIPMVKFNEIIGRLNAVLSENPRMEDNMRFKMGDSEFGFIPNLEDMTFGEYIDLDTYIGDMENIEKAMAVLFRPIIARVKDKYIIDKYKDDLFHDAMLDMPMTSVVASIVFFYRLGIDLSNAMMNSLQEEEIPPQLQQVLEENGVGINHYTDLLKEISDDLTKSQI